MAKLATVKIVSKDSKSGYMVINKSDFKRGHVIFDAEKKEVEKSAEKKEAIKKETPEVKKENKKK